MQFLVTKLFKTRVDAHQALGKALGVPQGRFTCVLQIRLRSENGRQHEHGRQCLSTSVHHDPEATLGFDEGQGYP